MYLALSAEQSRKLDRYMMDIKKIPGIILMENAAGHVAGKILDCDIHGRISIVCGTGNNGGDGFALARILFSNGYDVDVIVAGNCEKISGDASVNFEYIRKNKDIINITDIDSMDYFAEVISGSVLIVDALFGTGLDRDVTGLYADIIREINLASAAGAKVLSIDIPSGVNADTGRIMGVAVKADYTVACQTSKRGHFIFPGAYCRGQLDVACIGDDEGCPVFDEDVLFAYTLDDADFSVLSRRNNTNKGDYGRLAVFAGSQGMAGAARMCAEAAIRSGAGLTTVGTVAYVADKLQVSLPEVMTKSFHDADGKFSEYAVDFLDEVMADKNAAAVGPGIGISDGTVSFVRYLVENYNIPKIFDADALNIISKDVDMLHDAVGEIVLTPHPKEFSRLSGLSVKEILDDPVGVVVRFATFYGVTVLLKGASTVIASPDGHVSVICADVPAMAKGGSGDVLTGIISALAAQSFGTYWSAVAGANIHVRAGFYAQQKFGEYSVVARDIIDNIGEAFKVSINDDPFVDVCEKGSDDGVYILNKNDETEDEYNEYTEPAPKRSLQYREM